MNVSFVCVDLSVESALIVHTSEIQGKPLGKKERKPLVATHSEECVTQDHTSSDVISCMAGASSRHARGFDGDLKMVIPAMYYDYVSEESPVTEGDETVKDDTAHPPCVHCNGAGLVKRGMMSSPGKCWACRGKGHQTPSDVERHNASVAKGKQRGEARQAQQDALLARDAERRMQAVIDAHAKSVAAASAS